MFDAKSFIAALLADPHRPDASRLPGLDEPDPAGAAEDAAAEAGSGADGGHADEAAATAESLILALTGLGTSSARIGSPPPLPALDDELPAEPPDAAIVRSLVPTAPSGLGTSVARLATDPVTVEVLTGEPAPTEDETDPSMPALFCPGPIRDDPALGELVNERLVEWAAELGIYPGGLDRLRRANFGRMMMLCHPATDDPERLLAASKCLVAEWATDDYYVDEIVLGADPTIVASRLMALYGVVDPADLPARYAAHFEEYWQAEPISLAFRSAMEHLALYTSATQMGRFQHQMAILFLAWNQEAELHRTERTPRVWEYLVQRHFNSYLPPVILIDPVAGYELPSEEFFNPRVRRAIKMACAANVLINDLHSEAFEGEGDHSLPGVIVAEEGCSYKQAVRRTIEIHNELMRTFVAEASALSLGGSPMLRRFFLDVWAWLGGSREWHATTGKYKRGDED